MKTGLAIMLVAALHGAAGVALAAAAAHVDANPLVSTASQFLTLHAGAGLGLAASIRTNPPVVGWLERLSFALQFGVTLFAADLASRVWLGGKLFPFAAPLGGGLTILSWAGLALWAIAALRTDGLDKRG